MKLRAAIVLCVALAACKGGVRGGAGVGESCRAGVDCARPLQCLSGACALPVSLQACTPNARRCDGADLLACDAAGLHEKLDQSCPFGCRAGACNDRGCTVGERRCGDSGVELCAQSGGAPAWILAEACTAGCDPARTTCKLPVCKPLETRCGPNLQVCSADGSQWLDQPCAAGAACSGGSCVAQRCTPDQLSCDGSVLVRCDAAGGGYAQQTQCPAGCANGACLAAACAPGSTRCTAGAGAVEGCKPDASGWAVAQQCAAASCATLSAGRAACAQAVCAPLAVRCNANSSGVEICLGDGSGWSKGLACTDGCSGGACLPPPAGCTAGALRCAGNVVEKCDGTAWSVAAQCLSSCSNGACAGASCAPGFTLGAAAPLPADGVSTVLVTSGLLLDAAGAPVADGTPVNVSATGGAQIVAPAAQVQALRGRVDFAVRAPPAPGSVAVSAGVAGAAQCAATLQLSFVQPSGSAAVAEDFTTDAARDFARTSAQWLTASGQLSATGSDVGDGRDGAFSMKPAVWDLTSAIPDTRTAPYAPVLHVTAIGAQSVAVEGAYAAAFQPGDEALLIELQGASLPASAAAGAWESLTVAQASTGQVTFTTPVLGVYGEAPGAALSGEKIVLQRVPHFSGLSVPAGATLTASGWDGQKGGVVAFRVSGTAAIAGAVQADALGFRGGNAPDASHGQAGESFAGAAPVLGFNALPQLGGGSGGFLCGDPYHLTLLDSWFGSGGSYGGQGASTCSGQGGSYGAGSLARIFHGSGSGSQEFSSHQNCAPNNCPAESLGAHGSASASYDSRTLGSWSDTSTYCANEIVHHAGPQQLPCATDACNDALYNSCAAYDVGHADGASPSDCSSSCPGLVVYQHDCTQCAHSACNSGTCSGNAGCNANACIGGDCGNSGSTTGFFGGCGSAGATCTQETNCPSSQFCVNNCNVFGANCDCHYECFSCCNSCNTCRGCATNPGCDTDVGCQTCSGPAGACDMTSGGGDCAQKCPNAWQGEAAGGRGGGVVYLAAVTLDLSGGGRISARGGAPAGGNLGGSGGSIFVKAATLKLAASGVQLDASGAAGGGAGRVRIDRGSGDDPVARQQILPAPYTAAFGLPQAQSLALPAGKLALAATLVQALDAGAVAYFISGDGGASWAPIVVGATVTFTAATADVRWRAQLTPLFGAPASVAGLSFALRVQ